MSHSNGNDAPQVAHLVRRFTRNTKGRDIAVGDIHGHFTKLGAALLAIDFSHEAGDRLFSVGDLVDRGPESLEALNFLTFVDGAVAGNHEDMAVRWPNGNMEARVYASNGGAWMMALDRETQLEVAAAQGLVGIVHAECPFASWSDFVDQLRDPALSKGRREGLIDCAQWARGRIESGFDGDVEGVRAVIVGHTPLERMTSLGNTIYIDTMGWKPNGHFTLLDLATLQPVKQRRAASA